MNDRPDSVVVAGDADSLDDLLARVNAAGQSSPQVHLVVPRGSSLLLTAAEFRRLRDAVDRARLGVTVRSDDPLREQLAGLLGVASGPIPPHIGDAIAKRSAEEVARAEAARRRPPAGIDPAAVFGLAPDVAGTVQAPPSGVALTGHLVDGAGGREEPSPIPNVAPPLASLPKGRHGVADQPGPDRRDERADPDGSLLVDHSDGAEPDGRGSVDAGAWPSQSETAPAASSPRRRLIGRRPTDRLPRSAAMSPTSPAAGVGVGLAAGDNLTVSYPARASGSTIAEVAARRSARPAPRLLGFAAALVALVGLAVAAAALLMPRATVAVTLERMPFQAEVVYDVRVGEGTEGSGVITIPATPVTTEVAVERTVPTTGRRLEPDGVAVAPVRFANPNPDPVTVEAETKLGSLNGQEFVLSAPVDVPAADAASGAAGQAEGEARAVQPGAGGNVGTGEIGGRLESGVYYSNRDQAAEGGTDREVSVVAREDLAAASDAVDQAITEAATAAVESDGADGAVVLPGSATIVDKAGVVDLKEGDVADTLGASATATVQVLVYDPGALTAAIDRRLPELAAVPEGRMLDPATVRFGEPVVESATAEGARLRVAVSGDAIPPFGPSERRALAERLAGGDIAAAGSLLGSLPGVQLSEIDFSPAWLPARMPGDPDRIEIEVVG